jgi:photosystem II stability/assembly factor-like uncharacterized protein
VAKSHQLSDAFRALASQRGAVFADVGAVANVGDEGLHLSRNSHPAVAALVAQAISAALATSNKHHAE